MSDDTAKAKFLTIQAMRLTGLGLVILAMAIMAGKIDLPEIVGYLLFIAGVLDALIVPSILARIWRTPS